MVLGRERRGDAGAAAAAAAAIKEPPVARRRQPTFVVAIGRLKKTRLPARHPHNTTEG